MKFPSCQGEAVPLGQWLTVFHRQSLRDGSSQGERKHVPRLFVGNEERETGRSKHSRVACHAARDWLASSHNDSARLDSARLDSTLVCLSTVPAQMIRNEQNIGNLLPSLLLLLDQESWNNAEDLRRIRRSPARVDRPHLPVNCSRRLSRSLINAVNQRRPSV